MGPKTTLAAAAIALAACSPSGAQSILADAPEADLSAPQAVERLGGLGSPVALYVLGVQYSGMPFLEEGLDEASEHCADVDDNRDADGVGKVSIGRRDCVSDDGRRSRGRIEIEVASDGRVTSQVTGLAEPDVEWCDDGSQIQILTEVDGSFELSPDGAFLVDLVRVADEVDPASCSAERQWIAVHYEGILDGSFDDWDARLSGRGEVAWEGTGRAEVQTLDEILDPGCANEAWSGTHTLRTSSHEAVIRFDGESTCGDGRATWSLDGEEQGTVEVACSSTSAPGGALGLLLGLAGLMCDRRRR